MFVGKDSAKEINYIVKNYMKRNNTDPQVTVMPIYLIHFIIGNILYMEKYFIVRKLLREDFRGMSCTGKHKSLIKIALGPSFFFQNQRTAAQKFWYSNML